MGTTANGIEGIIPSAEDLKKELLNVEFQGEFGEFAVEKEEDYYDEEEEDEYYEEEDYDDLDEDEDDFFNSTKEESAIRTFQMSESTLTTASRAIILGIIS